MPPEIVEARHASNRAKALKLSRASPSQDPRLACALAHRLPNAPFRNTVEGPLIQRPGQEKAGMRTSKASTLAPVAGDKPSSLVMLHLGGTDRAGSQPLVRP